jgi:long-chain fatty acid transport protein
MKKLAVMVALLAATPAFAVNGMRMIGFGPVQATMGGVGVGASLDAGTTVSNPAGMADLGGRFDFGAAYFDATVKATLGPAPFESGRGATPIPGFGLIVPIGKDFRFGIGAYGVAGVGVDYTVGHTNYSQMRFTPAISWKPIDMLSVGATLNVMYANLDFAVYLPPPAFVVAPGGAAFGFGVTLGAKLNLFSMLDVGVAYESKSSFADFKSNGFDGAAPTPYSFTFDQPPALTFGVGLKILPMLLVAADLQWLQWSSTQGASNQIGSFGTLNWEDQWVLKIGVELAAIDFLKIRAGYNYGKSPVDPNTPAAVFLPAIAESHVTLGVGLQLASNVALNLGTVISPEATLSGPGGAYTTTVSGFTVEGGLSVTY